MSTRGSQICSKQSSIKVDATLANELLRGMSKNKNSLLKLVPKDIISIEPSKKNSSKYRIPFTKEEDENLTSLAKQYGTRNWSLIASFVPGRTPKQCRDRYSNYLVPGFFKGEWSKEEDELLFKLYTKLGPKWAVIKKSFRERSSNSIKNRWNFFLCRQKNLQVTNAQYIEKNFQSFSSPESQFTNLASQNEGFESFSPSFQQKDEIKNNQEESATSCDENEMEHSLDMDGFFFNENELSDFIDNNIIVDDDLMNFY